MIWMIIFATIGAIFGAVYATKNSLSWFGFSSFTAMLGLIIGVMIGGISTGITLNCLNDSEYEWVETERCEIATTEAGEVAFFDVKTLKNDTFIYYLNKDGNVEKVNIDDCKIEFVDSDFRVIKMKKRITTWKEWFCFENIGTETTIYVPEDAWLKAHS